MPPADGTKSFILSSGKFTVIPQFNSMPSAFSAHFALNSAVEEFSRKSQHSIPSLSRETGINNSAHSFSSKFQRASRYSSRSPVSGYLPDDGSKQNTGAVGQRCDRRLSQHDP